MARRELILAQPRFIAALVASYGAGVQQFLADGGCQDPSSVMARTRSSSSMAMSFGSSSSRANRQGWPPAGSAGRCCTAIGPPPPRSFRNAISEKIALAHTEPTVSLWDDLLAESDAT
ncbi:hypothetical protein [Kitasatospora cathayae]|uniref:DUF5753 domain-containing protein n=1 Tax=Kitasatospora cathayae TaxID=3004092 RepID=A0ABY7PXB2_9ACTN|nr:hypothetical protein [Kitasatospora sp. HUAS 3-15]WBP85064.1 hypothetical protein O1G21_03850 [Kitasatospora sp. HUAS 3-15]